jgi:aspartate racemase
MTCVGIVGGLGVGATVHYYEKIAAACKARGAVPGLVFVHADVDTGQGFVRDGKLEALADYLAGFIDRLRAAGAHYAVLPAVTPHICIGLLTRRASLPLISIVDPLVGALRQRAVGRVALFGTRFTIEGSLWGQLKGVEIVKPRPDEIAYIGAAYQRILDDRTEAGDADGLRRIASELQSRDAVELILLAGTDLAVMFDEASAGFPCLDVARLHIDAIVERLTT